MAGKLNISDDVDFSILAAPIVTPRDVEQMQLEPARGSNEDPPGYIRRRNGLFWQDPSDPEKPEIRLAGPFDVVAETRDADGAAWGVLLAWRDHDGRGHEWAMPRALLAGDGADVRRVLLDGGLYVAPGRKARDLLNSYLASVTVQRRARAVSRIGWHGRAFVLPDGAIGDSEDERSLLQTSGTVDHAYRVAGTLAEWRDGVARFATGNSRLVVAISAALAAPLLEVTGAESGGFHFRGPSSTGKSTALVVAGSVWGGGGVAGYVRSWRATANGLEGVAAAHCDTLLCLDELGQVAARDAGEVAYLLGNGAGKSRAARDGTARRPATWRLLFLSSGEIGLADKVAEDGRGRRVVAGQQVRVLDIAADAQRGMGMFEQLHGFSNADAFARHIKSASASIFGTPGRALVEALVADDGKMREAVIRFVESFVAEHAPASADGQVTRAARRFALVAAAGELAVRLGILPWPQGEAERGAAACFADWIDGRGGIEPAETREGIAQVRRFLEQHGEARFSSFDTEDGRPTINRAGFRRQDAEGGTEFFVLPQIWKTEVAAGFDPTALARALADRGHLIPDRAGKFQAKHRLPGMGSARCYHLSASILRGEDGDA
jgi:putative DNA primase/helicase